MNEIPQSTNLVAVTCYDVLRDAADFKTLSPLVASSNLAPGVFFSFNKSPSDTLESLKPLNEHGVEYWSARDLMPCLGYSQWRRFENAIQKAIESCRQSGNNPKHHFAGAGKLIIKGTGLSEKLDTMNDRLCRKKF